jgi:hypothetical protein
MPRRQIKIFECPVIQETVQIALKRPGLFGRQGLFVQCDQLDCQYVEENKPPCPLTPALFAEEIQAAEAAREARAFNE